MNINEYMQAYKKIVTVSGYKYTPCVTCADGFNMSVQADKDFCCEPQIDDAKWYTAMEIGFPSEIESLILEYANNKEYPITTIYEFVPVEVIDAVIAKHGGLFKEKV